MFLVYLLYIICLIIGILADERPIVKTQNGLIRGNYKVSKDGRQFRAFEGIPYAEPPIGERRFEAPEPRKPWKGIWDASIVYTCIQMVHTSLESNEPSGVEDCLYLNVYSPKQNEKNNSMDVIVYFHGGAFMFGQPSLWGPEILMDYNVIYININYRVGPLGFLSTQDDVLPGNNGLKDQTLALKWIKQNIHNFGGNPDSITITGLSAGGSSVHFHYMSPLSRGLFNRGISISGTALCNWALVEDPLEKTKKLGAYLGCEQESSQELVDCLRQRSPKQITQVVKKFQPWLYNPYSPFGPVVEPKSTTEKGESFLPDLPYNLLKNGQVADVEWITSITSEEGLYPAAEFLYKDSYLPELEANWYKYMPYIMHYDGTIPNELQNNVSQKIKDFYLYGEPLTKETYPELVQAMSDRLFVVDAEKGARLQATVNKAPVYFYKFSYQGDHSLSQIFIDTGEKLGVSHADDVLYVVKAIPQWFKKYLVSEADKKMSKILINLWLSFAKTGKPNIPGANWPQVSKNPKENLKLIHFISPDNIVAEEVEELGCRSFWDSLLFNENEFYVNKNCN